MLSKTAMSHFDEESPDFDVEEVERKRPGLEIESVPVSKFLKIARESGINLETISLDEAEEYFKGMREKECN